MKILNRTLSQKTTQIVVDILETLTIKVYFRDIKEINQESYGSADCSTASQGFCTVYLKTTQTPIEFETTLLHELRHVWQMENGYPCVGNKIANSAFDADKDFLFSIGSQLQSAVLDLDVIEYLEHHGYPSTIFSKFNESDDLTGVFQKVTSESIKDPWNLATAVLQLYIAYVRADNTNKPIILSSASSCSKVIEECTLVSEKISQTQCNDPTYCAYIMCWLIDHFSLWKTYFVEFHGKRIRTHGEFERYFN